MSKETLLTSLVEFETLATNLNSGAHNTIPLVILSPAILCPVPEIHPSWTNILSFRQKCHIKK